MNYGTQVHPEFSAQSQLSALLMLYGNKPKIWFLSL